MKLKYKPCCSVGCMLAGCKIRAQGGCYCVCRLKDHEETLKEKSKTGEDLEKVREILKTYEIAYED